MTTNSPTETLADLARSMGIDPLRALVAEFSVPDAAILLGRSREWIKSNLPIVHGSERGQRVRLADIHTYQQNHIILPKK